MTRTSGWLSTELHELSPQVPTARIEDDPADVATRARQRLRVPWNVQEKWRSTSIAFDEWRHALERCGVAVFLFPLGEGSCRGFSLWRDALPVIAVNTAWNEEARVFTLFHEFGHLITRTSSACIEGIDTRGSAGDRVERWCEAFAAALLMPDAEVRKLVRQKIGRDGHVSDVNDIGWLARRFKTSLRAATIRLIELGLSSWTTYRDLPVAGDKKLGGGGGGGGRVRREIREDQLGDRATELFLRGVSEEVMSRTQALTYLDVTDADFRQLVASHG